MANLFMLHVFHLNPSEAICSCCGYFSCSGRIHCVRTFRTHRLRSVIQQSNSHKKKTWAIERSIDCVRSGSINSIRLALVRFEAGCSNIWWHLGWLSDSSSIAFDCASLGSISSEVERKRALSHSFWFDCVRLPTWSNPVVWLRSIRFG